MIEKTINGKSYLFVEVPNVWHSFVLDEDQDIYYKIGPLRKARAYDTLPEGYWEIIGKTSDLTEEQWKEIIPLHDDEYYGYEDYADGGYYGNFARKGGAVIFHKDPATLSGISLIASLNLRPETTLILQKL